MDLILEGYAIVFNKPTVLWEYEGEKIYEQIDRNALDGCDTSLCAFKYNHEDSVFIAAATRNNSLELKVDNTGLLIRAKLANTQSNRDLYEMVKTRLLQKMSFAFMVGEEEYDSSNRIRTIKKFKRLYDVSAVPDPAYPQTTLYVVDEEQQARELDLRKRKILIKEAMRNADREKERKKELELLKLKISIQSKL